jgi:hypothetical protein
VFAIGFVLGVLRTLWLVPLVGERLAELLELPVVVIASWAIARVLMRGRAAALGVGQAGAVGLLALALLLLAEVAVVVLLRAESVAEYVAERDPVAGTAYVGALLLFAAMPALAAALRPREAADARR